MTRAITTSRPAPGDPPTESDGLRRGRTERLENADLAGQCAEDGEPEDHQDGVEDEGRQHPRGRDRDRPDGQHGQAGQQEQDIRRVGDPVVQSLDAAQDRQADVRLSGGEAHPYAV